MPGCIPAVHLKPCRDTAHLLWPLQSCPGPVKMGEWGGASSASSHPEPLPPEGKPSPLDSPHRPPTPKAETQHYLPARANICKPQKGMKKPAGATYAWKRMQNAVSGVPSTYLFRLLINQASEMSRIPTPTPVLLLRKHWNSINLFKDNHSPDNRFFHLPSCGVRSAFL